MVMQPSYRIKHVVLRVFIDAGEAGEAGGPDRTAGAAERVAQFFSGHTTVSPAGDRSTPYGGGIENQGE